MTTVRKWSGRETRLLREALRLSVRGFAEYLGVPPRTVSKWEQHGAARTLRPEFQAMLDTALARATDDQQARFDALASAEPSADAPASLTAPAIDAGEVVATSAAEAASFAAWWETINVGQRGVEILFAELRRLASDYLGGAPEPVVLALHQLRTRLFELLRVPQSPQHARDLHLAAGYASALLAWLSGDFGRLGAADTQARTAVMFADTSGSAELGAWIWAVRSKTSFWLGDYTAAAEQAGVGLSTAPATEVRVLLAAQTADAWATIGAAQPARAALHDMAAAREAVTAGNTIGGLLSCSVVRQANYESGVHQQLGAATQAIASADEALRLAAVQPVRSYATEAQIRLNQVDVFLDPAGVDVAAAAEALEPVLLLPPNRRLHTLTRRVSHIGDALGAAPLSADPAARGLQERCTAFVREATTGAA